jgi:hypothetical protein
MHKSIEGEAQADDLNAENKTYTIEQRDNAKF